MLLGDAPPPPARSDRPLSDSREGDRVTEEDMIVSVRVVVYCSHREAAPASLVLLTVALNVPGMVCSLSLWRLWTERERY